MRNPPCRASKPKGLPHRGPGPRTVNMSWKAPGPALDSTSKACVPLSAMVTAWDRAGPPTQRVGQHTVKQ